MFKSRITRILILCIISVCLLGSLSVSAKSKLNIKRCTLLLSETTCDYNGEKQEPEVTLVHKGKVISPKNYTVTYSNNVDPGEAKVVVEGKNKLEGTVERSFYIKRIQIIRPFVDKTVTKDTEFEYEVNAITPVTYRSSDTSVAKVDQDGTVRCIDAGKAEITAIAKETDNVQGAKQTLELTVTKYKQEIKGKDALDCLVDDTIKLKYKAKTKISYKISETDVAELTEDNKLKCNKKGEFTLYISAKETEDYLPAEKEVKVRVQTISSKAAQDAVDWAIEIAEDNSFHYGHGQWSHRFGCYFCGTNQPSNCKKALRGGSYAQREKTYCCNPFVTAAYCHGAEAKEVDCTKSGMRFGLAGEAMTVDNFVRVAKPASYYDLEPGDILLTTGHAMLYAGDGNIVEAGNEDNGVKGSDSWNHSIRLTPMRSYTWRKVSKIYRYTGRGKY